MKARHVLSRVLVLALLLPTAAATPCAAIPRTAIPVALNLAAPRLLFTDLESGPKTGGQDNLGAFITLYGEGFGATRGSSTVTIGGAEVARYVTWGQDNGIARGLDMIVVQPGPNVTTGNIVVTVNGLASNPLPFAVRSGQIYFVIPAAPNASDSNPGTQSAPWRTVAKTANGLSRCETEEMDAEDPLFMLYTSGTTGKPKAILHTHGGYMVGVATTLKMVFDLKEEDRYWCTADPGWITGHSYIVYGPLLVGATSFMYEGAPSYPYPNRWWSMIERYGINVLYTAPTAIRGLMRFGEAWPNRHDLSSLRLLGTVGEPINPEAWRWYFDVIGKGNCPIMDTWWQTETGMFMITPMPASGLKPGSATRPFPGIEADIYDESGKPVGVGEEGYLVLKKPWPAMLRTIYKDPERYVAQYWTKFPGVYFTGDSARKDADGYFWIIGRVDDVIKVSGYRLGTAEIESALVSHPAVAEAAAIGLPHELKGNAIHCFVMLRAGYEKSDKLAEELRNHVGHEIGPIAKPEDITFVDVLPKTRSGKIMRRLLRARALGMPEGDLSTLEE